MNAETETETTMQLVGSAVPTLVVSEVAAAPVARVVLTKEEKFHNFVDSVRGVEPYESFFRKTGEQTMSETRKIRQKARREWLAFMRINVADYLARWPEACEDLMEYLHHLLEAPRYLRPQTRYDAEAVLAATVAFSLKKNE